jgi:hypothetical protein
MPGAMGLPGPPGGGAAAAGADICTQAACLLKNTSSTCEDLHRPKWSQYSVAAARARARGAAAAAAAATIITIITGLMEDTYYSLLGRAMTEHSWSP